MTDRRAFLTAALAAPIAVASPALAAPAFDPAAWVRQFIALGGTLSLTTDGPRYGFVPENMELTAYVRNCNSKPDQWSAVKAYARSLLA